MKLEHLFGGLLILGILALGFSCEAWKYSECKKVGHCTAYCIWKFGQEGQ